MYHTAREVGGKTALAMCPTLRFASDEELDCRMYRFSNNDLERRVKCEWRKLASNVFLQTSEITAQTAPTMGKQTFTEYAVSNSRTVNNALERTCWETGLGLI